MGKVEALKEKITAAKAALADKLDKITFIKKIRERRAQLASAPADPASLGQIYRSGGVATRLQIILIYLLMIGALAATYQASRKFLKRLSSSKENEKLKEEYSHGLAEMSHKVVENANLISLGKFTSPAFSKGRDGRMLSVDIWLRVSDPEAADFATKNEAVIYDRVVDALDQIYRARIDLLNEQGKIEAKSRMLESMNKAFPKGRAEDVLFQNLVIQ